MTVGPGMYAVGTGNGQVAPGKYFSPAPSSGSTCYYARLRNNDGDAGDIIAEELSQGADHHDRLNLRRRRAQCSRTTLDLGHKRDERRADSPAVRKAVTFLPR